MFVGEDSKVNARCIRSMPNKEAIRAKFFFLSSTRSVKQKQTESAHSQKSHMNKQTPSIHAIIHGWDDGPELFFFPFWSHWTVLGSPWMTTFHVLSLVPLFIHFAIFQICLLWGLPLAFLTTSLALVIKSPFFYFTLQLQQQQQEWAMTIDPKQTKAVEFSAIKSTLLLPTSLPIAVQPEASYC